MKKLLEKLKFLNVMTFVNKLGKILTLPKFTNNITSHQLKIISQEFYSSLKNPKVIGTILLPIILLLLYKLGFSPNRIGTTLQTIKALHIIAIVTWFAGLFYLPRLFVYHAMSNDTITNERFKVMERKLYRGIMNPSAIIAVLFGVILWMGYGFNGVWLHIKATLVLILIGYHHICGYFLKKFANDENNFSHVFYRWFNEFPVLILIACVFLVIFKPM